MPGLSDCCDRVLHDRLAIVCPTVGWRILPQSAADCPRLPAGSRSLPACRLSPSLPGLPGSICPSAACRGLVITCPSLPHFLEARRRDATMRRIFDFCKRARAASQRPDRHSGGGRWLSAAWPCGRAISYLARPSGRRADEADRDGRLGRACRSIPGAAAERQRCSTASWVGGANISGGGPVRLSWLQTAQPPAAYQSQSVSPQRRRSSRQVRQPVAVWQRFARYADPTAPPPTDPTAEAAAVPDNPYRGGQLRQAGYGSLSDSPSSPRRPDAAAGAAEAAKPTTAAPAPITDPVAAYAETSRQLVRPAKADCR